MTQPRQMTASAKDWALIFILSLIWGASFLFGRVLMLEWPPFFVVFLRVFIAAITLWLFLFATRQKVSELKPIVPQLLIMGLLNNAIPFSLILIGQKEIGSGLAAIVNAMTPIWTLLIAHQATSDEKLSMQKALGIALGFLGVTILIGADLSQGLSGSAWAQCAVLGATISYGCAGVYGKRFASFNPINISTGQLTASSLIMLPIFLIMEAGTPITAPTPAIIISIIGFSVLCTAFAYVLYFKVLASAGATNVSLVTFLVPVSAVVLGVIFLNETLKIESMIGGAIILIGLITIDGRALNWLRKSD